MLRSMLVVLDGSPSSEPVIALAFEWAARFHARVLGLGVVDAPAIEHGEPVPMGAYAYKKQRDEARLAEAHRRVVQVLQEFRARSGAAGVDATTVEDIGDPAEQVLREAQRCDVVLLARETRFQFETGERPAETLTHVIRATPGRWSWCRANPGTAGGSSWRMAAAAKRRARCRRSCCWAWPRAKSSTS
jgi:nucleotide-binding universal stress UspA family protein